ncbi:MAG: hypothetical protein ACYDAG_04775, partial [Chloroflexota bacterium]
AGAAQKRGYASGTLAAETIRSLVREVSLEEAGSAPIREQVDAMAAALREARERASRFIDDQAPNEIAEFEAHFDPSLFERLGPEQRAGAAEHARQAVQEDDGHCSRFTAAILNSARAVLAANAPQSWAERLAGQSQGLARAAQVLQTELDRLPVAERAEEHEPQLVLDDRALEPLLNGVEYRRPPLHLSLMWLVSLGILAGYIAQAVMSTIGAKLVGLALVTLGLAFEIARATWIRRRKRRSLALTRRVLHGWADAWLRWARDEWLPAEQRRMLEAALAITRQRTDEVLASQRGFEEQARRALDSATGAGWNLSVAQPTTWVAEVEALLATVGRDELEALWREAAGADGGAFLVGNASNQARIADVARGWAQVRLPAVKLPAITPAEVRARYARLHEGAGEGSWQQGLLLIPCSSGMDNLAFELEETGLPRIDQDRVSGWLFQSF